MNVDLKDIRLFVAVYEEGSFTAAAKREFTTQPSISQHIRKVEERLNTQLFVRGHLSIDATPAGEAYYKKCVQILKLHAEAVEELKSYAGDTADEMRVGLMQSITRSIMAPAMDNFMNLYPNVTLRVFEAFGRELVRRVRSGELEFAIVPSFLPEVRESGMESIPFTRSPEFLVSRKDERDTLTPVKLADMEPFDLILPPAHNLRRAKLEEYIHRNGVQVNRTLEIDASSAWLDFASRTQWKAIMPGMLVISNLDNPNIALHPIVDPPLIMELVLIYPSRSVLSGVAQKFVELLQIETAALNQQLFHYAGLDPQTDTAYRADAG